MTDTMPRRPNPLGEEPHGDPTGVRCPLGCGGWILYNGNYFCSKWGYSRDGVRYGGDCNWVMNQSEGVQGTPEHVRMENKLSRRLHELSTLETLSWEVPLIDLIDKKMFEPIYHWRRWRKINTTQAFINRRNQLKKLDRVIRKYVEENPIAPK